MPPNTWRKLLATVRRVSLQIIVILVSVAPGFGALAQTRMAGGGDVLLTFDTEYEGDAESIVAMGIDVPATYFWTGEYAKKYPELLRRLAEQGHTIGSHSFSHDDLTTIGKRQVQLDLELAKLVLEDIAGVPITAFRAPFLQYDERVMAEVERLGFLFDSSDKSPWPRNRRLLEIAVSEFENLLVSDYDIFETLGLDSATSLDFLIRAYDAHAAQGRPFVVLLHPRIIGQQAQVLHDFIAHVDNESGRFLSLDGYIDSLIVAPKERRVAIWAELGLGMTADTLLSEVEDEGATDVILNLPDAGRDSQAGPTLVLAAVRAVQVHGVRIHLAFPMLWNPQLSADLPAGRMRDMRGVASTKWVSPSHPEVRRRLIERARRLVGQLGVDGIHLYGLGYPDLAWDFSPAALQRFTAATSVSGAVPEKILSNFFLAWTQWRSGEVARLVAEVGDAARLAKADVVVSLSLLPEAAIDYRLEEATGQDYRKLGRVADLIVPLISPFMGQDTSAIKRLMLVMRTQAGSAPVLLGVNMPGGPRTASRPTATLLSLGQVLTPGWRPNRQGRSLGKIGGF